MYKHILVPLDGSSYSEAAVPYSIKLARSLKARLTFLHIIEKSPPESVHGDRHLKTIDESVDYLGNLLKACCPPGIEADFHVHAEDEKGVVRDIAVHHDEISSDLIVMTTHGWGGVREIFFGNIAEQILKLGTMPVLFIPPSLSKTAGKNWPGKVLLPLDGTGEHEAGYDAAVAIARAFGSKLYMALVIPTLQTLNPEKNAIGILLPGTTRAMLDIQETDALKYLENKRIKTEAEGLKVKTEICRGDPAAGVNRIVNENGIELIVLGTHGKAGLSAFWAGSIGAKIKNRAKSSILFVPIV